MSDYTETFTKVDGNTIEAADFETEFTAIETAIATKADKVTGASNNIVFLDDPETLLSITSLTNLGTSGVFQSSSAFASTTLPTNNAVAAIIRVFHRISWTASTTDVFHLLRLRKAGSSSTSSGLHIAGQRNGSSTAASNMQCYLIGEGTVPLDGASDFEYSFSWDSTGTPTHAQDGGIYLIGYYV
jgi:hypothetical protein